MTGLQEKGFGCRRVELRQAHELGSAFRGDDFRGLQKVDKSFPRQIGVGRSGVDKLQAESPTQKWKANRVGKDRQSHSKELESGADAANNQLKLSWRLLMAKRILATSLGNL